MIKVFSTIALLLSMFSFSQSSLERDSFKLDIIVDEENNYGMDVPKSPYFVKEKILQIFPGEKINVETEVKNDTIFSMKVVKEIIFPERTITIDFSQKGDNRKQQQMFLVITNPYDRKLFYSASMYTPKGQSWVKTNVIPIQPKLVNYEMWPHSIITLVLENWRFME